MTRPYTQRADAWTEDENALLRQCYSILGPRRVAPYLPGRSLVAIKSRALKLKICFKDELNKTQRALHRAIDRYELASDEQSRAAKNAITAWDECMALEAKLTELWQCLPPDVGAQQAA